jgi:hypothetical protein
MQDRIAIDPEIHFGKPCVAGTRIPVQNVLELIREGLAFDQITRDYYPKTRKGSPLILSGNQKGVTTHSFGNEGAVNKEW